MVAGQLLVAVLLLPATAVGHATANYTRDRRDQSSLVHPAAGGIRLRSSSSAMLSKNEIDGLSTYSSRRSINYAGDHGWSNGRDLECNGAPSGKLRFCYWAIETGTAEMILYSNRNSSALIERNIKPFCEPPKSDQGVHGITFVDRRIPKKYVDDTSLTSSQRVLTDVFYFCCSSNKGCAKRNQLDVYEAIDTLADDLLEFASTYMGKEDGNAMEENLMPKKEPPTCIFPDGKSTKIPGTLMCIFMMDASSTTKIYSGPPMFNYFDMGQQSRAFEHHSFAATMTQRSICAPERHSNSNVVDDDRCYKYISKSEYILICCCYKEPRKCALSGDNRAYFNARSWGSMLAHQAKMANSSSHSEEKDFFNWTKMSYVLATPLVSRKSGFTGMIREDTKFADSISSRVRYIHCAQGHFVAMGVGAEEGENYTLWRHKMASLAKYCAVNLAITYHRAKITRAEVSVGTATDDQCEHGNTCILTGPRCFNDLIREQNVTATFTCCCQGEHLCNHHGRKSGPGGALLTRGSGKSSCASDAASLIITALNIGHHTEQLCARAFALNGDELFYFDDITHYSLTPLGPHTVNDLIKGPNKNGECMRIIEFPKRDQLCDRKQRYTLLPVQFIRCMCAAAVEAKCDKDFQSKTAEILKKAGSEVPSCMDMSTTVDISIDGAVLYETKEISTVPTTHWPICENTIKLEHEKLQFVIRSGPYSASSSEHKRFSMRWNVASRKCFAKAGRPPCNGEEALLRHVAYYMKYFASQRKMKQNSQCPGDKTDKPQSCNTRDGCFNFHAIDGTLLKQGCIDQIDTIVQRDQKLEFLGFCMSRTVRAELERQREKKGAYYCSGVTHNIANWNVKEGLLCCCPQECPNTTLTFFPFRGIAKQQVRRHITWFWSDTIADILSVVG